MSNLRNRVQLIGHLGADPETKNFDSGSLAKINIATNDSYKTASGEWKEETTWHNVIAWGPIADRVKNILKKGSYVLLEGKLCNRTYTNEQNEKKYITEVRINNFVVLDKKSAIPNADEASISDHSSSHDNLPF